MAAVDPVTAIANAISGLAGVAQPFIDQAVAQKYETEFTDNISDINETLSVSPLVPNDVDALVLRLLSQGGQTIGAMGPVVGISMGYLAALLNDAAAKIKADHLLANVQFKENQTSTS